jgi:hypothetical protein
MILIASSFDRDLVPDNFSIIVRTVDSDIPGG